MPSAKILITGIPTSGKTTLLQTVIATAPRRFGFLTQEVRNGNDRSGFEMLTSSGRRAMLADVTSDSPYRVSRYGVDLASLDMIIASLYAFEKQDMLYLDEIGEMEFFSPHFAPLVRQYIDAPNPFIGTLSKVFTNDLIAALRQNDRITLIDIDELGRNGALERLHQLWPSKT